MTVMRAASDVARAAGYAGWPLLPAPEPGEHIATPASSMTGSPLTPDDASIADLTTLVAALNDGSDVVFIDHWAAHAA